ncbi:MAG: pirin family protein [Myxococcota bacterium]
MTWRSGEDPILGDPQSCAMIETVVIPNAKDLGGFEVRRVLPSAARQMVGPFIFFDQMGPAEFLIGEGIDVRPHPHIGLATVTYLFEGEIYHRDSLGNALPIHPGAVNWMTAGKGIVHSERTSPEEQSKDHHMFGIQTWVALPEQQEEIEPAFAHHAADSLPLIREESKQVHVILGDLYGQRSPVQTYSNMFYAHVELQAQAKLPLDTTYEERGIYIVSGSLIVDGIPFEAGRLLVCKPNVPVTIEAATPARLMLLGGDALEGPRYVWWNFVSSRRERIEDAKHDWANKRFDIVPGDEEEFIPLPS